MRALLVSLVVLSSAVAVAEDKTLDLVVNGVPWARTVVTPYDDSSKESREATYKVYTHLMDFPGHESITKGAGGQYTHHRGLFIGWRETTVGDKKFDTWHMTDCYQQHAKTIDLGDNVQRLYIEWRGNDGTPILNESRTIVAQSGTDGSRVFDFSSVLNAIDADVTLRGDSHHAGMQVRLSNEVAENPDASVYVLPEGAKRLENDEVSGATWVVCAASVGGKKYWVMHMAHPQNPGGVKLYSIRPYARFGAFSELDVTKGNPVTLSYRIVVSEHEITAANAALYTEYARSGGF